MPKTKQPKTKTYTVRIEWPVTYYCDTTVEATSAAEAASIAMEDPDYDNQSSYDDPGSSKVEGVCEGDEYSFEEHEEAPKESKTTAGAWSCDYGDFSVFSEAGAEIARVVPGNEDGGRTLSDAEMEANLNLIAASPTLLAALAAIVGIAEADCLDDKSNVWRSAMVEAEAAIAKAEGRG